MQSFQGPEDLSTSTSSSAERERESCRDAREDDAVVLADAEEQAERTRALLRANVMVVTVAPPAAWVRGALAEHVDELVERELASRGAPSPYLSAWAAMSDDDAEARIGEQLFRARSVGATGIALVIGSLAGIGTPSLCPEDSDAIAFLARSARRSGFVIMLDLVDAQRCAYRACSLAELVAPPPRADVAPAPSSPADSDASLATTDSEPELLAAPDAEPELELRPPTNSDPSELAYAYAEARAEEEAQADLLALAAAAALRLDETHVDAPVAARDEQTAPALPAATALAEIEDAMEEEIEEAEQAEAHADAHADADAEADADADADADAEAEAAAAHAHVTAREAARRRATIGVPVATASDAWRAWALALGAARGPQPLAAFERLFTGSYMPLANAIAAGLDDPRAIRAHDEFRRGFERSYTDAFATFGATGRRPRLVMDAYDVALKQARLHNARTSHVLVVDAMRWDMGCLVRDMLSERAAGAASLTTESLLWSALPTTTYRQLETLARGMDALRAPMADEGTESLRGRPAETVRRMRVGSRELYKLDVVPAMLGTLEAGRGGPEEVAGAIEAIAGTIAGALQRHIQTLLPRTLLLVVGDHGFTVDRRGNVTHGGASPEEVLVPALAYLIGDLH